MIRVLVADDHELIRDSLYDLVCAEPDLTVVACAADGLQAVTLAVRTEPDVVLMDLSMPRLDGISATREVKRLVPATRVLVLSFVSQRLMVRAALDAGADGYLVKDLPPEQVLAGIRSVAAGGFPLAALVRDAATGS